MKNMRRVMLMRTTRLRLNLQEVEDLLAPTEARYRQLLSLAKSYGRIYRRKNSTISLALKRTKRLLKKLKKARERLLNPKPKKVKREDIFFIAL